MNGSKTEAGQIVTLPKHWILQRGGRRPDQSFRSAWDKAARNSAGSRDLVALRPTRKTTVFLVPQLHQQYWATGACMSFWFGSSPWPSMLCRGIRRAVRHRPVPRRRARIQRYRTSLLDPGLRPRSRDMGRVEARFMAGPQAALSRSLAASKQQSRIRRLFRPPECGNRGLCYMQGVSRVNAEPAIEGGLAPKVQGVCARRQSLKNDPVADALGWREVRSHNGPSGIHRP